MNAASLIKKFKVAMKPRWENSYSSVERAKEVSLMQSLPLLLISKASRTSLDTLLLYLDRISVLWNDGAQGHLLQ